jgi:hypothetical protein
MSKDKVYVGIDLHKRSFSFVMLSASGEKLSAGKRSTLLLTRGFWRICYGLVTYRRCTSRTIRSAGGGVW